jgi:hypothetical protein
MTEINDLGMNLLQKIFCGIVIASIFSCHAHENKSAKVEVQGTKLDSVTGLTAKYKGVEPGKIFLMMNGEVLNHTDIPIGESFTIVIQNAKGFTVKFDNISLGCSVMMEDSLGHKIFSMPDLYAKNNLINVADANLLTCSVKTPDSLKWEQHYKVTAVFWDKYGDGKIENTLTFRAIDVP